MHIRTNTERRFFNRTNDDTGFDIKSRTCNTTLIVGDNAADRTVAIVDKILDVSCNTLIVYIFQAKAQTQKHAVVDVTTEVEIIFADVSALLAVQQILVSKRIAKYTLIINIQMVVVQVVQLGCPDICTMTVLEVKVGFTSNGIISTDEFQERQRIL